MGDTRIEALDNSLFDKLQVFDGDISPMLEPDNNAIAIAVSLDLFWRDEFICRVETEIVGSADDKIGAGPGGYILLHAEASHKGTQRIEQCHRQCQRHHHQHFACDLPWFHAVCPVDGALVLFQAWKNGSQGLSGGGYQIYGCNAD